MLFFLASASCALYTVSEERTFVQWMRDTNNIYTGDEYHFRLGVFMTTLRYIEDFNRDTTKSYRLGVNHLCALTRAEYQSMLGTRRAPVASSVPYATPRGRAPDEMDWRTKGVVNPIRDQGQCGSCWAFGCIQASESSYALAYGDLLRLSESNLVDCCDRSGGCDGGFIPFTLEWIRDSQNGKVSSQEDYPYAPIQGSCHFDPSKAIGSVKGYLRLKEDDEENLKEIVGTMGPCVCQVNANPADFHTYRSGIYNNPECIPYAIDHSVGCVGYGNENGDAYWIIRNSWGEQWGEKGYMRLARNAGNLCSIATEAYHVTA